MAESFASARARVWADIQSTPLMSSPRDFCSAATSSSVRRLPSAPKELVEGLAVAEVAHLHLHKGAQVARRAVLGFHDEMGLAVEFDDLAFADVVGCRHGRGRKGLGWERGQE